MNDPIVAFIMTRLDEDEAVALAAIDDDNGNDCGLEGAAWLTDGRQLPRFGDPLAAMARRFAVPRRILREVERKRGLLTDIQVAAAFSPSLSVSMLSEMAGMWSDHADFRPEWSVTA